MGPKGELEKLKEALTPLGAEFWETDKGAMWFGRRGSYDTPENHAKALAPIDTHVTIVPYFTVPEEKLVEFKKKFGDFYKGTRAGTKSCLYYGFHTNGNKVFCREGYQDADGVLAHLKDVEAPLAYAAGAASLDLSIMGPAAELEKLKE